MRQMSRGSTNTSKWFVSDVTLPSNSSESAMTKAASPFALPATLSSDLGRVRDYWESLKRGENNMPFWDDVKLSSLPDLADRLMLVDAFQRPQRFRFNSVGERIRERYGANLAGEFMDEIDPKIPLEFFTAQASATIESRLPTLFSGSASAGNRRRSGYARLLLPMWGNGHIEMMLGAMTFASKT
jgi:hypothetical protein